MTGSIFPIRSGHDFAAVVRPIAVYNVRFAAGVIALLIWTPAAVAQTAPDAVQGPVAQPNGPIQSPPARRIGAPPTPDLCIQVDIAGYRAGHVDCAAQSLEAAAKAAQQRARARPDMTAPDARSADVVTGVANRTATRQRMGNTFGVSVRPQRPQPPVFAPPLGSRR